jgi:hypothetical protein
MRYAPDKTDSKDAAELVASIRAKYPSVVVQYSKGQVRFAIKPKGTKTYALSGRFHMSHGYIITSATNTGDGALWAQLKEIQDKLNPIGPA